uniref:Plexin b2a, tandem duplicate 1 n=1 Tax=Scophthalmus maximus TaxID=52904 RepID=A0A8D3A8D2_SCOMX
MERRWAWHFALVALATMHLSTSHGKNAEFLSDTLINNVVANAATGRLYVGAVNGLYQLSADLQVESRSETGPKRDNRQCTPPVTDACEEAVDTDNHNKLLLVHGARDVLVVCGSVFRGICSLRNLSNVEQRLYFSDTKGEKSYVASAEEGVSVVGVMSYFTKDRDNFTVFLVGKGYGSHDSTKLISTRILQDYGDWVVFDSIIEASAVQANPFVLRYLHDFRFAFKDGGYVYFLFSRTLGVQDNKNFTFVSRMCEDDQGYYSYTELQLNCSVNNKYNKAQVTGATVSEETVQQVEMLFPLLCAGMYPVRSINRRLVEIIGACYSDNGIVGGKAAVYSPYSSKSEELCSSNNQNNMALRYKCGAEFLPSPLASKAEFALTSEHALARKGHMTAVAVAVEMGHAVAFLGTASGELDGVFVLSMQITKVPVQACHLKTDCQSCVSMKDPYCGWCVLEGSRGGPNTWLWSPAQQCVQIQSYDPPNLSRRKTQQVVISIPALPRLRMSDTLHCVFDSFVSGAVMTVDSQVLVTCSLPNPGEIPPTPEQQDFVSVPVKVVVNNKIVVTTGEYHFYNCAATVRKNQNTPCIACVTSQWGCQWDAHHSCSDSDDGVHGGHIVKPRQVCVATRCDLCLYRIRRSSSLLPQIVPRFGPLNGRISVTIKGSNMGIKGGVKIRGPRPAVSPNFGAVLSFVVCEIGPARRVPPFDLPVELTNSGAVQIEVEGGRSGTSRVMFTYRDPKPERVDPAKGPAAGGTVITIKGEHLDTATKDDIAVTVGGVACEVLSFGERITCKTGKYRGQKVPSDPLTVTVRYGRNTTKDVPAAFQYSDNPKITDYYPKASFACGGRRIVVVGNGFDLIQRATVRVQPSDFAEEFSQAAASEEFVQETLSKNDTVLQFLSPPVNSSLDPQSLRTILQLDNVREELKNFVYHPDPSFNDLAKNVITETSIIIVTGRGFSKAMTVKEAQAFVGDASCHVNILQDDKLILEAPSSQPRSRSKRQRRDTTNDLLELVVKFGHGEWLVGSVYYDRKDDVLLAIIIPAVIVPMLLFIAVSVYCYRRKSQQAEREYEKVKHQLENLEESVRDRCKKEFTDLMIEMEDHTSDLSEARIPFLDYKTYTDRNFFLPSKDGTNHTMITGKIQIPEARKAIVAQALNQFSNLLNSKTFLINFIHTLESRPDFNARSRGYFASLLTVALHGKLEYYTDIMRTLLLELMDEHVQSKNPKLMLRRSETVVERMLYNWMSICLYQFLRDTTGEPLYKLFKALKHQVEKGPVDAKMKKAKYTLNDTGLLGDDVEYAVLTLQVLVHGEGPDVTPVKVLNCDTITQVKEKIIDQVYRNLPYSQRPKVESVALEWRPGSTGQILSDLDLTSQKEGRWKRLNTLAHYNVRDNATLVLSRVLHTQSFHQHQDSYEEKNALLEDDNTFHLVRPADELDEGKSKRGSMKDKAMTKAITEIYLTRLLSVKGTLQQFVDDFFRSVLCSNSVVPPAVKYFFDFLDEQALRHDNVDEETLHIWKTNSLPMRFWVNILRNPHFIFDVHVTEVVDASLHVISQTFMDACTKTEHKLSRESPSNKLLYAKEISTYKKNVDDYYRGIRQMVPVSDQDMNTHLAEVSRQHTDKLNSQVALHQLYQYASKYYDVIIQSLDEDPAAQNKQLTLRLQQIAAALENKVTDL